jgi:HK97 family phage major capsid protein
VGASLEKGITRKWIQLMAGAKLDGRKAAAIAQKRGQSPALVRALNESTFAEGGAFVPEVIAAGFIEELYNESAFLQAGPRRETSASGNKTFLKQNGKSAVAYAGELQAVATSQPGVSALSMSLRKVMGTVVMSNEWDNDSSIGASFAVDDLLAQAGQFVDLQCLQGTGLSGAVKGLVTLVQPANVITPTVVSGATFSSANVRKDLQACVTAVKKATKQGKPKLTWIMNTNCESKLMTLVGTGDVVTPIALELAMGKLLGYPVIVSDNVPGAESAIAAESKLILVDMNHIVFLEGAGLLGPQITRTSEGTVGGINLFEQDAQAIRLTQRFDLMARHEGKEIAVLPSWLSSTAA